jgi:hypothetical protein
MSKINYCEIVEGNLKAEKDTGDFGGPNMWRLHVKNISGLWESVQWMNVYRIQKLFKSELPVYREVSSTKKYQLEKA